MKKMSDQKLDKLLSLYVDGVLTGKELQKVETLLKADISVRIRVKELRRLKELLASKQKITPDIGFWTRFSAAMEGKKREERNLLPFPRKFIPAAALLATAVIVLTATFIIQNRMQFIQFFSEKSQVVRDVYEKNLLDESLLPLFSRVDKDHALQFSLFGTLSLDEKSETELRVDEQSEKGYRIEVGKDSKSDVKKVTFKDFLAEIKPTSEQRRAIDSLLELTGRRIESSVLIGENNTMAVAPDLPKLNKIMVTNIASCLEPQQRLRLERLLEVNDAPYSVKAPKVSAEKGRRIFQNIPKFPKENQFVIITPDTMMYSQINIDFDSLRRQFEEDLVAARLRRETMLRRIKAMRIQYTQRRFELPQPARSAGEEEIFGVEINLPREENDQQQLHVIIQPRIRRQTSIPGTQKRSIQMHGWKDTTSGSFEPQP